MSACRPTTSAEMQLCGKPCGEFVVSVEDGIAYEPPKRVPATCRREANHEGPCYP